MMGGTYHEIREIREIHFEDGWSCIARFTRDPEEPTSVMLSEAATTAYLRKHSTIPVPKVYFINPNPNHVVGAPFVIMEKLLGRHLGTMFQKLSFEHQLAAIGQLAEVQTMLMNVRFDKIGSLQSENELGPLQDQGYSVHEQGRGPFKNVPDWVAGFLTPYDTLPEGAEEEYPKVADIMMRFFEMFKDESYLTTPDRLLHGDFDLQNVLFELPDPEKAPRLTGVIDWDYSQVLPLYFCLDYPEFLRVPFDAPRYRSSPIEQMREHYLECLLQAHPEGSSEREMINHRFHVRSPTLDFFRSNFTGPCRKLHDLEDVEQFLQVHELDTAASDHWFGLEDEDEQDDADSQIEEDDIENFLIVGQESGYG